MAAVVPPEVDVGDIAAAKVAVLQSASHVQVIEQLSFVAAIADSVTVPCMTQLNVACHRRL